MILVDPASSTAPITRNTATAAARPHHQPIATPSTGQSTPAPIKATSHHETGATTRSVYSTATP